MLKSRVCALGFITIFSACALVSGAQDAETSNLTDACYSTVMGNICLEKYGSYTVEFNQLHDDYFANIKSATTNDTVTVIKRQGQGKSCQIKGDTIRVSTDDTLITYQFEDGMDLNLLLIYFSGVRFSDGTGIFDSCNLTAEDL